MKLKSKLIATIVSICAAIAVMGVGVWAAAGSFKVSVENTISLSFTQLDGDVSVATTHGGDDLTETAIAELAHATNVIYDASEATEADKEKTIKAADGDVTYAGTNFFTETYLTANTNAAFLQYEFKYTAPAGVSRDTMSTSVTVTEASKPTATIGSTQVFDVRYFISVNGTEWVQLESATAVYVDAADTFYVRAICAYKNGVEGTTAATSITVEGTWNFAVDFAPAAAVDTDSAISTGATLSTSSNQIAYIAGSTATTVYSALKTA